MLPISIPSNKKLAGIPSFSLPVGSTCPGKTQHCKKYCYAKKGNFRFRDVKLSHRRNMAAVKRVDFVDRITKAITKSGAKEFRLHPAGDFFAAWYVRKWIQIVKQCPSVQFWAYTRSWRVKSLRPALTALGSLPNMRLWLSCDVCNTHRPSMNFPIAYVQSNDDESVPSWADLVFRVRRTTISRLPGQKVCPAEDGRKRTTKPTCVSCKYCLRN